MTGRLESRTMMIAKVYSVMSEAGFWDRKVRIALLTLATFIALC
jgi:hypothetical protein